jgi:hypothetical protein
VDCGALLLRFLFYDEGGDIGYLLNCAVFITSSPISENHSTWGKEWRESHKCYKMGKFSTCTEVSQSFITIQDVTIICLKAPARCAKEFKQAARWFPAVVFHVLGATCLSSFLMKEPVTLLTTSTKNKICRKGHLNKTLTTGPDIEHPHYRVNVSTLISWYILYTLFPIILRLIKLCDYVIMTASVV